MPNAPKTPMHAMRIDDETWAAAKAEAERRGETVTDAVHRGLRRYAKLKPAPRTKLRGRRGPAKP